MRCRSRRVVEREQPREEVLEQRLPHLHHLRSRYRQSLWLDVEDLEAEERRFDSGLERPPQQGSLWFYP